MSDSPNQTFAPSSMPAVIGALMLREMATSYGRHPGGYAWAIAEPVGGITLLTVIFSLAFTAPPLGSSFALFYASGYLLFSAYLNVSNKIAVAIRFSKPLLFYPAVRFSDPILARFVLNALVEILVIFVVLGGIVLLWGIPVDFDWSKLALAVVLTLLLALGVGTLNCVAMSLSPIWERVWAIVTRPLFVISTIFFLFDAVPHPYQDLLWFNPLIHTVALLRAALYPGYEAAFAAPLFVAGIGAGGFVLGMILLGRWYREIINN